MVAKTVKTIAQKMWYSAARRKLRYWVYRSVRIGRYYKRKAHNSPPVVIYQMGKVASSSIRDSLIASLPGLVVHSHNIMENEPDVKYVYEQHISVGKPVFVITLVREPIIRNISAFFQNFERETGIKYHELSISIEELITLFLENDRHDIPLNWFDIHMKGNLGVDVYRYQFPSTGIQTLVKENIQLMILRAEVKDEAKQQSIERFLNVPNIEFIRRNIGTEKRYASTYKLFQEAFIAPDWYIDKMYNSKYFNHFYSEEEKNRLIHKWTKKE